MHTTIHEPETQPLPPPQREAVPLSFCSACYRLVSTRALLPHREGAGNSPRCPDCHPHRQHFETITGYLDVLMVQAPAALRFVADAPDEEWCFSDCHTEDGRRCLVYHAERCLEAFLAVDEETGRGVKGAWDRLGEVEDPTLVVRWVRGEAAARLREVCGG